ncbi:uncharacterized protein LOC134720602 [Mytilus trossulus]|uniref:uncharacterized protein LOC134720602 n=1 Tax=Mytilus trossulus TaxID=6551 RepID=UPI003007E4EE
MNIMMVFFIGVHGFLLIQSFVSGRLLKPRISFDKYPFVGERVHFKCNLVYESNNTYTYFYGNVHSRDNFLDVTHLDKGRKVYCQSTNWNGVKSNFSNELTLDPHYGPEDVQISPTGDVYNVTEHDRLSLVCSAKCNPGCKFSWTNKKWQKAYLWSNLKFNKVKRVNGGLYSCHANHREVTTKTKVKAITINVLYSPTFSDYIRFDANFTMSWNYNFPEGKFNFLVFIQSNPTSSIRIITSDLNIQVAAHCSRIRESGYYRLGLPRMSCENSGNYTLVASNGIGMSSNRTVQLTILCKPKELLIAPNETHTKLGQEWIVQLSLISNPKPNVTWVNRTSNQWELIEVEDLRFKFTSVLKADQLLDYGVYGVKICNTIGCITEYVVLHPKETMDYLVYAVSGGGAALFLICIVTCWFCCRKKRQQSKAIVQQHKNIQENGDHENVEHLYDDITTSYFSVVHYRTSEQEDTNAFTNPGYVNLQQPKQEIANHNNKNEPSSRKYVNIK